MSATKKSAIHSSLNSFTLVDASSLIRALMFFHPITEEMATYFQQHLKLLQLPRKTLLLSAGATCQHLYFIKSGAIRGYLKNGNKEVTTWISVENEIVTSIGGLNVQLPSKEYIQTIEPCELLVMNFEDLEALYEMHPPFNIVGRKLLQKYYHDAENRALVSRLSGASQRYLHFLETQEHLANRIPLTYIASFLGMRLDTLSKVRKKIALTH